MPHPCLAAIILGVTVATVLYFMFGTNEQRENTHRYRESTYDNYSGRQPSESEVCDQCPICLCTLQRIDKYVLQACKHQFHKRCIEKWRTSATTATCPVCRCPFA